MNFIKSTLSSLSISPSLVTPEPDTKKPTAATLFPQVDPAVDGPDCRRDCASCTTHYPKNFDIDIQDRLFGNVDGWSTHVLVATGKTDWVRDVADEAGSVMEALSKQGPDGGEIPVTNGTMKLSASNMPVPDEYVLHDAADAANRPTSVLLLPAFTIVDHVTPARAHDLVNYFVNPAPTNTSPLFTAVSRDSASAPTPSSPEPESKTGPEVEEPKPNPDSSPPDSDSNSNPATPQTPPAPPMPPTPPTQPTPLHARPCPHAAVILLCSQRTRDYRCGQSAPLIKKELDRHLRAAGLYRDAYDDRPGGVAVYFISHVGGHKYAANAIVYRRAGGFASGFGGGKKGETTGKGDEGKEAGDGGAAQGIWLARIRPEDCEGLVKYTVLQGKLVNPEEQLRGGFDRVRGVTSW